MNTKSVQSKFTRTAIIALLSLGLGFDVARFFIIRGAWWEYSITEYIGEMLGGGFVFVLMAFLFVQVAAKLVAKIINKNWILFSLITVIAIAEASPFVFDTINYYLPFSKKAGEVSAEELKQGCLKTAAEGLAQVTETQRIKYCSCVGKSLSANFTPHELQQLPELRQRTPDAPLPMASYEYVRQCLSEASIELPDKSQRQ